MLSLIILHVCLSSTSKVTLLDQREIPLLGLFAMTGQHPIGIALKPVVEKAMQDILEHTKLLPGYYFSIHSENSLVSVDCNLPNVVLSHDAESDTYLHH